MSGEIPGIAGQAVNAAVRGCDEQIEALFTQACADMGQSVATGVFLDAFALEAARAIDESQYIRYEKLFVGIQSCTGISLGQICSSFIAEGADPALLPAVPQERYYGTLSAVKGDY